MKKTLLILVLTAFTVSYVNAQTVWDFGNSPNWPEFGGYSENTVVQNLGMFPGVGISNLGAVENNNTGTWDDGYVGTRRFKLNGASYDSGVTNFAMPTKRYIYFTVAGPVVVKIWFKTGGSGMRTLYVTDGTNIVGSLASTDSSQRLLLTANYVGTAGNLYIAGDQACNIMKIEVTGVMGTTTLGTDDFEQLATKVYSNGSQVFISNVLSATAVKVYNITGQLVKSLNTTTNTDFQLNQGMYIVNIKNAEGAEKSVKVLMK